jgi:hypothetical protein
MSSTPSSLYFAQAFHHGEPDHRSYVVAVGSKDRVEALARAERAKSGGEYGVAIYAVAPDAAVQEDPCLVEYLASNMGEHWTCNATAEHQHA